MRAKASVNADVIERVKAKLKKEGQRPHQFRVSVGIHPEEGENAKTNYEGKESHATILAVATWLEFGTDTIEARPFIRTWYDQNISRLKNEAIAAMRSERKAAGAVAKLADKWKQEVVEWLSSGEGGFAALAPSTEVARIRAGLAPTPPLYATGQLADAIRAVVEDEGPAT